MGDNATGSNAQSFTTLKGKVLRVGVPPDPLIPPDNPFFGSATGNNRAIWALGLRNPFTFAVQPGTGRIFVNDVGENTWEEINDANAGNNFGWPTCEGDCNNPSYEDPFYTYNHSVSCSIAGGAFYNPDVPQFPASYVGKYFFADYCGDYIKYVDPTSGSPSATTFATLPADSSPVDVQTDFNGYLYYIARGEGKVYRVTYTGSNAPTITENPQSQLISTGHPVTFAVAASGQAPLSYQWQRNSVDIPLATLSSYTIGSVALGDDGDLFRCIVSNGVPPNATSAPATLTVTTNQPPAATITLPTAGTTYAGGDIVDYAGTATDPENGALPGSAFTWWVTFHHDTHFHPFLPPTTGSTGGSITIPTVGETSADVWYRIHLQVVDAVGLTDEKFVDVIPRTTTITLATSPDGLQLTLDGQPLTAPQAIVGVEGIERTIGAPSPQSSGGNTYVYFAWSDGGAQTHGITTPAGDTTYTASFTSGPTPTFTNTNTPSNTPTRTPTFTPTQTPTGVPPAVSSIAPSSGPAAGGTGVTVTGSNFLNGASLAIGGAAAGSVTVVGPTQITGTAPALPGGNAQRRPRDQPRRPGGRARAGLVRRLLRRVAGEPVPRRHRDHLPRRHHRRLRGGHLLPRESRDAGADGGLRVEGGARGRVPASRSARRPFSRTCPCPGGPFVDWVNQLAAEGITGGCGGGNYCPASALTRAQMAVFLLKGKHGSAYLPPACSATVFADVPCPGGPIRRLGQPALGGGDHRRLRRRKLLSGGRHATGPDGDVSGPDVRPGAVRGSAGGLDAGGRPAALTAGPRPSGPAC